ncbi:MAG: hypothetical protein DCC59_04930 [Chloroflexi bacterium]|nr:hypothetical protein [Chloroflexi bacterium CFX1]MCK6568746.1 hypothetical protein [Anaerolineales bacterium]MCQ3954228.1 hypothetical protein [Chloroflexota bacterium]MDL1920661.1 hypothetical protein [Chloroflexi bacterium CFX5]NUQ59956.1 hypothetical protein [Anaerolineales bacterium]
MTEPTAAYCYNHPARETTLRCKRCERYICTSCAVGTPTGYMCRECVNERQKTFDTAVWYDFVLGFTVAGVLSGIASFLTTLIGGIGFFGWLLVFLGSSAAGGIIAEAVRAITRRRRSRPLFITVAAGVVLGALPMLLLQLLSGNVFGLIFQALYLFIAAPMVFARLSGIQLTR